jgi:putative transposase
MELEVESRTGARYGEKSSERLAQRNGYRDRSWETRAGTIELRIPKLRQGSYFPAFLEPRRMAEKAFAAVVQEAYVQGVSTRSVDDLGSWPVEWCSRRRLATICGVGRIGHPARAGRLIAGSLLNGARVPPSGDCS